MKLFAWVGRRVVELVVIVGFIGMTGSAAWAQVGVGPVCIDGDRRTVGAGLVCDQSG